MERAVELVDGLTAQLESAQDHGALALLGTKLHDAQTELTRVEERWVAISLELEES